MAGVVMILDRLHGAATTGSDMDRELACNLAWSQQ
jgi:hypothetical protein